MKTTFEIMEQTWIVYKQNLKYLFLIASPAVLVNFIPQLSNPEFLISYIQKNLLSLETLKYAIIIIIEFIFITLFSAILSRYFDGVLCEKTSTLKNITKNIFFNSHRIIGVTFLALFVVAILSAPYISVVWFISHNYSNYVVYKTLFFSLPLLIPAIYAFILLLASGPAVILDNENIISSVKKSKKLIYGRLWKVFPAFLGPQIGWSLIQSLITFVIFLLGFLASVGYSALTNSVIDNKNLLTVGTLTVFIVGIIIQTIFLPLTTGSIVVWYRELTKNN